MLFYNSVGPNPRVVRMFMAERGIEIPRTEIDLRGGENRQPAYMAKNPAGQMPWAIAGARNADAAAAALATAPPTPAVLTKSRRFMIPSRHAASAR